MREAVTRQALGDGAADALAGAGDEDRPVHSFIIADRAAISVMASSGW